jgi:uncharacterized protein
VKCPSELVAPLLVVDTGPLIALTKISLLSVLPSLFGRICIPQAVAEELQLDGERPDALALKAFMQQNPELQVHRASVISARLSDVLDAGEAEAIALAGELGGAVLIDEKRGRSVAIHWKVPIIGTGRLLLAAKKRGCLERVGPVIDGLRQNGYRLADSLVSQLMTEAGE